jgi:hypothetical protein
MNTMIEEKALKNSSKKNITKTIRKGISALRAALEVYMAVKKKDPVYIGMGMLSTYDALELLLTNKEKVPFKDRLTSAGLQRILVGMENFVYSAFIEMDLQYEIITDEGKESKKQIIRFNAGEVNVYFIIDNTFIRSMYCKDEDRFVDMFSKLLIEKLGQNISITIEEIDWQSFLKIDPMSIPLDTYISTIDEKGYYENIIKFREMNLNRSTLLYGPPGCGKTTYASRITKILKGRLVVLDAPALNHAASSNLQLDKVFKILSPTVVLFDDIDRIHARHLDLLLGTIENLNKYNGNGELIIMASVNKLSALPDAMKRPGRFDEILFFKYPDNKQREGIIRTYLSHFGKKLSYLNIKKLIDLTEKMTPAFIKEIVLQASILPFEKIPSIVEHIKEMQGIGEEDEPEGKGSEKPVATNNTKDKTCDEEVCANKPVCVAAN